MTANFADMCVPKDAKNTARRLIGDMFFIDRRARPAFLLRYVTCFLHRL